MSGPIFWHSGGQVMCAKGPLALTLRAASYRVCTEEEALAIHRAAALGAVRVTLSTAVVRAETWRRAAGWDDRMRRMISSRAATDPNATCHILRNYPSGSPVRSPRSARLVNSRSHPIFTS